jgi:hypothetical protein
VNRRPRILFVQSAPLPSSIVSYFDPALYELTVVRGFALAKVQVDFHPDVLITELRLAEYNGLHLALRALSRGIPAIVVGDADFVLERDAERLGVSYLRTSDVSRVSVVELVAAMVRTITPLQRDRFAWATMPRQRPMVTGSTSNASASAALSGGMIVH